MSEPCPCCPPSVARRALFCAAAAGLLAPRGTAAADYLSPGLRLAPAAAAPRVALTIDACSGAADMRVIGGLIGLGARATVFATARWMQANPGTVGLLRERRDLFALENHGARHLPAVLGQGRLYGLPIAGTIEAVRAEVGGGSRALAAAGAPAPRWYRGATALYSPEAIPLIHAMGLRVAGYSVNGDEGASLPAAAAARRIAAAGDGDVIIAHANRPDRPSGPGVVEGAARLKARGMAFAWLDGARETADSGRRPPA